VKEVRKVRLQKKPRTGLDESRKKGGVRVGRKGGIIAVVNTCRKKKVITIKACPSAMNKKPRDQERGGSDRKQGRLKKKFRLVGPDLSGNGHRKRNKNMVKDLWKYCSKNTQKKKTAQDGQAVMTKSVGGGNSEHKKFHCLNTEAREVQKGYILKHKGYRKNPPPNNLCRLALTQYITKNVRKKKRVVYPGKNSRGRSRVFSYTKGQDIRRRREKYTPSAQLSSKRQKGQQSRVILVQIKTAEITKSAVEAKGTNAEV